MRLEWVPFGILVFLSGEILVRRLLWNQVPSQVGAGWVFGLLVFNVAFLVWRWKKRKHA